MMSLQEHGPDTFVGVGPGYPWGGLYGGQIVAQALRAAALTVEDRLNVHSLHAFFIRRGEPGEPIRFEVDRLRNGSSFVTRSVVARQSTAAILNMSASFQIDEPGVDIQGADAPPFADPDGLEETTWSPMFARRYPMTRGAGRAVGWLRMLEEVGDEAGLQACALAYMSDDLPTEAVMALHPDLGSDWSEQGWMTASLDHAIWFHRPVRAEGWLLQDFCCDGLVKSRGLAVGRIFTQEGTHVASVAQEVLLRPPRP